MLEMAWEDDAASVSHAHHVPPHPQIGLQWRQALEPETVIDEQHGDDGKKNLDGQLAKCGNAERQACADGEDG